MAEVTTARFFRKATHVRDLSDDTPIIKPSTFEVAKVVELTASQYRRFSTGLMVEMPFITANQSMMGYDEKTGTFRCLLVTCRERADAVLVDSEGFDYARYAAYVQHKDRIDLRDVPVERYNSKTRGNRSGHER